MEASARDLAEFARLGLRFRLLPPSAIIEWADRTIVESEIPTPWVIELSLSKLEAIDDARGESRARHTPISPLASSWPWYGGAGDRVI